MHHHKYSLTELENMIPWEREIYLTLLMDYIKEENAKQNQYKRNILMNKQLEENSKFNEYDLDGDGVVSDKEMAMSKEMMRLENEDKKQDAQRNMAWFALFGMLLYPFAVVLASWVGLEKASSILGDMAPTYFVSVAAIVAAFYAKEVLGNK